MSTSKKWILNALRDIEQVCLEAGAEQTGKVLSKAIDVATVECAEEVPMAPNVEAAKSGWLH